MSEPAVQSAATQTLKWGLVVGLLWLGWLALQFGLANQAAHEKRMPEHALAWKADHAAASLELGLNNFQRDPVLAADHLRRAIRANPADGRAYAALAVIHENRGDYAQASQLMQMAGRLSPQRSDVQLQVGAYFTRRGDTAQALTHLDTVLRHRDELRAKLFPELLKIVADTRNTFALAQLLRKPVPWWKDFFIYAARTSDEVALVRHLYRLDAGSNALPEEALRAYLQRLQKEGAWTEAWFVWLNSLPKDGLAQNAYVYNGSFERPVSNVGFDWISHKDPSAVLEVATTYGTTGERALYLVFKGMRSHFRHLSQYTLLPPGKYYLQGRVRPERLEAALGMQWILYCEGKNTRLAETETFRGSDQWTRFRTGFVVGTDCPVQKLQLELAGRIQLDYDVTGAIWFDDIAIEDAGGATE